MPKRVTSLRAYLCAIAPVGNTVSFKRMSQWWRAVGNTLSALTGARFEPPPPAVETNALPLYQLAGQNQTRVEKHLKSCATILHCF